MPRHHTPRADDRYRRINQLSRCPKQLPWVPAWVGDMLWATTVHFLISALKPHAARWERGQRRWHSATGSSFPSFTTTRGLIASATALQATWSSDQLLPGPTQCPAPLTRWISRPIEHRA